MEQKRNMGIVDKYPYREEKENKEGNDLLCELRFL